MRPRVPLGGGAVVQSHPAKQGGLRRVSHPLGREPPRSRIGRTGGQELLAGSGLMPHRLEEMHPRVRLRLGPATELPLHGLNGVLCHLRQHQEACVGYGGSGTRVIGRVAADCARRPRHGMVRHVGHQGPLKRRQQRLECWRSEAGHRASTPGPLGDLLVAWHRHLRHGVFGREAGYTRNLDKV